MKKETDTRCEDCRKAGIMGGLFSVKVSRMEEYLNHRVYECDKCHKRWKFTDQEGQA